MDDVPSREGKGHIVLSPYGEGSQALSTLSFQYPLKLISPRLPSQPCTSVFIMSYGGGLVGGDQIELMVNIQRGCKLSLLTQGSTKIFKQRASENKRTTTTSQSLRVKIEDGGLLALLPDPIQPFADSCYNQYQSFELHPNANLILLDWINSGRPARGENWSLTSLRSRNDVFEKGEMGNRLLLRDTLILNSNVARSMYPHECFATLILRGPLLRDFSESLVGKFKQEDRVRRSSAVRSSVQKERATWTAGIVRDGCCVVKIAGETGETVKHLLTELLVVDQMETFIGREALRAVL
jgi:urease accessory protein UreH